MPLVTSTAELHLQSMQPEDVPALLVHDHQMSQGVPLKCKFFRHWKTNQV